MAAHLSTILPAPHIAPAPLHGKPVLCVHCFRSLGVVTTAAQRLSAETAHRCAEKMLAWQPAAPPPFN
jgi:hypothetical protein